MKTIIKKLCWYTTYLFCVCWVFTAQAQFLSVEHVAYNAGKVKAISPNGNYFLSKGSQQYGLYTLKEGRLSRIAGLCCFRGKRSDAQFVDVGSSTQKILTFEQEGEQPLTLKLWSIKGQTIESIALDIKNPDYSFSIESSGRYAFVLDNSRVTVVNLDKLSIARQVSIKGEGNPKAVWGNASLNYLAIVYKDNQVKFYDLNTKSMLAGLTVDSHTSVNSAVFVGRNQQHILLPFNDRSIVQFDIQKNQRVREFSSQERASIKRLYIDKNGENLFSVSSKGVSVFDINQGKNIAYIHVSDVLKEGAKRDEARAWFNHFQFSDATNSVYVLDNFNSINQVIFQKEGTPPVGRQQSVLAN
ncbi:hypothetical protein [Microbulbifer sp. TYP-18]|uniref:hypothetical protein n=1 Tax=Microbulbifer sp. TYP-18 TaxID=3230024 RepID=UPI0034C682DB